MTKSNWTGQKMKNATLCRLEKTYLVVHHLIDETCFCKPDVDKYTAQEHLRS
jgi:hypothetical protein